ncbi:hypothetical protein L3X38_027343 [Prunus dulcis]|uniref:Uncharacterized protein n=1 Tax=Prunus dulcis TaxID=3755 RepID=A0AAD4VQB6_PRUDU|nr:hypothetical protein L3X38_027343 [Prunus dulcis]
MHTLKKFKASRVKFQLIIIVIWACHKTVLKGLLTLNPTVSELPGHLDPDLLGVGLILLVPITCGIHQFLLKDVNLHPYSALAERELRTLFPRSNDGRGVSTCKSHSDAQVSICAAYS